MRPTSNLKTSKDEAIIAEKKELNEKLNRIQDDLKKLKRMRNSPIDGKN